MDEYVSQEDRPFKYQERVVLLIPKQVLHTFDLSVTCRLHFTFVKSRQLTVGDNN